MSAVNLTLTRWASFAALAAVGMSAMAAEPATTERSRAEVVSETLSARAAHQLAPAGEFALPAYSSVVTPTSGRSRAEVTAEVAAARSAGQLLPAGEAPEFAVAAVRSGPTVTRAAVKADVLAARANGELVPAGEGPNLDQVASVKHRANANLALRARSTQSAGE